jgi:hypothetical protein
MTDKPYSVAIGNNQPHGPIVLHCERVTWLNRAAGIGFIHLHYRDRSGSCWFGRALAGPDGCEFFTFTAAARHDQSGPHFADQAAQVCVDYLIAMKA